MLYLFYAITIVFLLISIFSTNSLLKKFCLFVSFIFLFIFLGWAAGSYDVEIGISRYINYERYESFTEIGFQWLINVGHLLKMNYRTFYIVLALFELLIIYWFVLRHSSNPLIVIALFMLFPMVMYFQYTRNILAFSFVLIAIHFLIEKKKLYPIFYILFIVVASLIHLSSLFFLLYLPLSFMKKKYVIGITVLLVMVLYFTSSINILNDFLKSLLGEDKYAIVSNTTFDEGMIGRVATLTITILEFWIVYFLLSKIFKVDMSDRYTHIMFCINAASFLFIILTLNVGSGFNRIPTLLTIINYCYFTTKIKNVSIQSNRVFIYSSILVVMIILFWANFKNVELRDAVLIPFFEGNELVSCFL